MLILLMIFFTNKTFGQTKIHNRTILTFTAGYNTYSPSAETPYMKYNLDFLDYGGFSFSMRLLLKTKWLNSRMSIGGEFGWFTLARGWETSYYYVDTGEELTQSDSAWPWQFLIGYLLYESDKVYLHTVIGFGGVNAYEIEYAMSDYGTEAAGSLKLLLGFPIASFISIDPEINILKSFGKSEIFTIQFLMGLSFDFSRMWDLH